MKLHNRFASAALAASLAIGCAAVAHAEGQVIPGTGYAGFAGSGESGTDAWGQAWSWDETDGGVTTGVGAGQAAWGTPGLGAGAVDMYQGSVPATDFEISFVNPDAVISQAPSSGPGGYNEATRMTVNGIAWTVDYISPTQVAFYAPAGDQLVYGDDYFVNVVFTNQYGGNVGQVSGANTGFTAVYTSGVPEPAAWAMLLVGVGGIGAAMRRKNSTAMLAA